MTESHSIGKLKRIEENASSHGVSNTYYTKILTPIFRYVHCFFGCIFGNFINFFWWGRSRLPIW